jgi:protein-disulfide isomerase
MRIAKLALAGAAAIALAACEDTNLPAPYTVVPVQPFLGKPVLGDPSAPVELTEYASTTCGHCRAFHEEVFPVLKANYIDTGKVKLHWVVLPTQPEGISLAGAAIARCAGESRYFDAIDAMFDAQDKLFEVAGNPRQLQQELNAIGAKFDLSPDQVGTCLDDESVMQATRDALTDMPTTITGTPSFAIGGLQIEAESLEGLSAALDAEIAKAAAAAPGEPAVPPAQ